MEHDQPKPVPVEKISRIYIQFRRGCQICVDERILSRTIRGDEEIHRRGTLAYRREQLGSQRRISALRRIAYPQHHAGANILSSGIRQRRDGYFPPRLFRIRMDIAYGQRTLRADRILLAKIRMAQPSVLRQRKVSVHHRALARHRRQTNHDGSRLRLRTPMGQRRPVEEPRTGKSGKMLPAKHRLPLLRSNGRPGRFSHTGIGTFGRTRHP